MKVDALRMSRQYLTAGSMVDAFNSGSTFRNYDKVVGKVDYLLATETIKYHHVIEKLLSRCCLSSKSLDVGDGTMKVMVYEVLFGNGKISGGGR